MHMNHRRKNKGNHRCMWKTNKEFRRVEQQRYRAYVKDCLAKGNDPLSNKVVWSVYSCVAWY